MRVSLIRTGWLGIFYCILCVLVQLGYRKYFIIIALAIVMAEIKAAEMAMTRPVKVTNVGEFPNLHEASL